MPNNLSTLTLSCIGAGRLGKNPVPAVLRHRLYWPDY